MVFDGNMRSNPSINRTTKKLRLLSARYVNRYTAGNSRLMKRRLFDSAAALSEAPGRHAARQITARVSRAAPAEKYGAICALRLGNDGS
jgi:hypothetical protein